MRISYCKIIGSGEGEQINISSCIKVLQGMSLLRDAKVFLLIDENSVIITVVCINLVSRQGNFIGIFITFLEPKNYDIIIIAFELI